MTNPNRGSYRGDRPQVTGTQATAEEIDAEIAQLEQELATLPQLTQGPSFAPPQAPALPGGEILQNPLLQAIQGDVTNRLMANQAARGKLGSGGTALALQSALAPTALNLGLTQQAREQAQQQQNIDNLFRLFGSGVNVAAGQGSVGTGAASGIGNALQEGGLAQAQGALGRAQAITGGLGGLAQIGGFMNAGGFGGGTPAPMGGGLFGTPFQQTTLGNIA